MERRLLLRPVPPRPSATLDRFLPAAGLLAVAATLLLVLTHW